MKSHPVRPMRLLRTVRPGRTVLRWSVARGEDPLETCTCDMPKGAVETKNFIRVKLSEGLTVEQVIELVDKKYGHRVRG